MEIKEKVACTDRLQRSNLSNWKFKTRSKDQGVTLAMALLNMQSQQLRHDENFSEIKIFLRPLETIDQSFIRAGFSKGELEVITLLEAGPRENFQLKEQPYGINNCDIKAENSMKNLIDRIRRNQPHLIRCGDGVYSSIRAQYKGRSDEK